MIDTELTPEAIAYINQRGWSLRRVSWLTMSRLRKNTLIDYQQWQQTPDSPFMGFDFREEFNECLVFSSFPEYTYNQWLPVVPIENLAHELGVDFNVTETVDEIRVDWLKPSPSLWMSWEAQKLRDMNCGPLLSAGHIGRISNYWTRQVQKADTARRAAIAETPA